MWWPFKMQRFTAHNSICWFIKNDVAIALKVYYNNNKIPEQKKKIQLHNLKVKSWIFKYLNCAHYNLPLNNQNYLQYSNFFGIFEISVGKYFTESTFSVWTESPIAPNRIPIHLNRFPNVIIPLSPSRQRFGIESSFFMRFDVNLYTYKS